MIRYTAHMGECIHQAPGRLSWEGHKRQAQLSLCVCGVPENLNLSGLDLRSAYNSEPASDISLQSNLDLSSIDWESTHAVSRGKPSVAKTL